MSSLRHMVDYMLVYDFSYGTRRQTIDNSCDALSFIWLLVNILLYFAILNDGFLNPYGELYSIILLWSWVPCIVP